MNPPIAPATAGTSTRPYLIRALHDWCTDNGFTPYVAVFVDKHVQVPIEYVKNNEIVLNVGFEATSALKLGNEAIEFKARFGGTSRDIVVPVDHVIAIYARENGQGMAFPMPADATGVPALPAPAPDSLGGVPTSRSTSLTLTGPAAVPGASEAAPGPENPPPGPPTRRKPSLKRVK
jgi:stringent starvation protein B